MSYSLGLSCFKQLFGTDLTLLCNLAAAYV